MKSTLKVHNTCVIILLIKLCINDVQGKELNFQVCNNYMKVIDNIQQPSLLAIQSHSDSTLTDGRLEGLELMHTLDNIQQPANTVL